MPFPQRRAGLARPRGDGDATAARHLRAGNATPRRQIRTATRQARNGEAPPGRLAKEDARAMVQGAARSQLPTFPWIVIDAPRPGGAMQTAQVAASIVLSDAIIINWKKLLALGLALLVLMLILV